MSLHLILPIVALLSSCVCTDSRKKTAIVQQEAPSEGEEIAFLSPEEQVIVKKSGLAVATVTGFQDKKIYGVVLFSARSTGGVSVVAEIYGLPPGKHGFHIHEHGDCSGTDGMHAGGHFNPTNKKHGGPGSEERHMGDLGNLEADQNGHASYYYFDPELSLEGPYSILDRSIIIHADPDDLTTQPTGNSGARIACGKIEKKS